MDVQNFPTQLKTLEDYQKASLSFVLPFLQQRAIKIAATLRELYETVEQGEELDRETVDFFLNQFREAASFADSNNPTNLYFKQIMQLEEDLDKAGAFLTEEINLET